MANASGSNVGIIYTCADQPMHRAATLPSNPREGESSMSLLSYVACVPVLNNFTASVYSINVAGININILLTSNFY